MKAEPCHLLCVVLLGVHEATVSMHRHLMTEQKPIRRTKLTMGIPICVYRHICPLFIMSKEIIENSPR